MSLKRRKIQKVLEAHSGVCAENLNTKLGTTFVYDIDWACMPEDIADWNWEHDALQVLFYNAYYRPVEDGLQQLFADDMYKEAILEQVKGVKIVPGRKMIADFDFEDGFVLIKHTMCVNHGGSEGGKDFVPGFVDTIENKLS